VKYINLYRIRFILPIEEIWWIYYNNSSAYLYCSNWAEKSLYSSIRLLLLSIIWSNSKTVLRTKFYGWEPTSSCLLGVGERPRRCRKYCSFQKSEYLRNIQSYKFNYSTPKTNLNKKVPYGYRALRRWTTLPGAGACSQSCHNVTSSLAVTQPCLSRWHKWTHHCLVAVATWAPSQWWRARMDGTNLLITHSGIERVLEFLGI
jgi:hypothetical protein